MSRIRKIVRLWLFLCVAGLVATPAPAAPGAGVSEADFNQLVDAVNRDPAALTRHRAILERLSAAQMARAIESTGNSHFTWLYPMVLRAQDYPPLAGTPIAQLSVVAVRGDKVIPIPFQVDEFDTRGLVFIQGVATPGPLNPGIIKRERQADGDPGRYDNSDELVFMYRDAGLRKASTEELAKVRGKVLGVIELRRDGLPPRYAYVMQNQPLRSGADYVSVDISRGVARTSVADIEWNPDSLAMIKRITPRVGPSAGVNIIDGVYGEVSTGVMQKDLRFSLNTSDNIRVQPVAVRDGQVRALMLVKLRIFYLGLPVFHDFINVAMYEQGASLLARVRLDSLDAAKYFINLIKEPRIEASIDFTALDGAQVRWQALDDSPERAIVDGHMSRYEDAMAGLRMPGDWLWLDSGRGWQFFFSNNFSVEPEGLLQGFLEGMDVRMIYEDDPSATRAGERVPGAGPRFGVRTSGMPYVVNSLLTSLRGANLSKLEGLEDLVDELIALEEKNKLERINQNINLVLQRLIREGKAADADGLADLLLADIRRIGFKPAEKQKLLRLARESFLSAGAPGSFRLGHALRTMKRMAAEEHIDLERLEYAMLDNSLWFPDQVGGGGPAAFDREVRNPPLATLLAP